MRKARILPFLGELTGIPTQRVGDEKDRFFSRLAAIPGIRPMPSIGDWILLRVAEPAELARKVNRRLHAGPLTVPRHVRGAVRVVVSDPKTNEEVLKALREMVA